MPADLTTPRRLLGYAAVGIAGALAALTLGVGAATASPRSPFASDTAPAPATPFDPNALLNALNDYFGLLSSFTGGQGSIPGIGGSAATVPAATNPASLIPGMP
ncbi:MAG: hypothetical protein ACRDUX_20570 [Mycobacterium sp.]